jgi:photosystem I subunit 9
MENLQKYLSTAPVLLTIWMTFTAGFIIEINRFFPDMLGLYFFEFFNFNKYTSKRFLENEILSNYFDLFRYKNFNFNIFIFNIFLKSLFQKF